MKNKTTIIYSAENCTVDSWLANEEWFVIRKTRYGGDGAARVTEIRLDFEALQKLREILATIDLKKEPGLAERSRQGIV